LSGAGRRALVTVIGVVPSVVAPSPLFAWITTSA
jgi:hypothetical protein